MLTLSTTKVHNVARRTSPLVGWGLLIGGVFFFAGGRCIPNRIRPASP